MAAGNGHNVINEGVVQHLEEWGAGNVTVCGKDIPPGTPRFSKGTDEFEVCDRCSMYAQPHTKQKRVK